MEHGSTRSAPGQTRDVTPELEWIYNTAPIGLAFLSPDCRYVLINEHLTEICGLSVAAHIGRSVRETVPQVAEQVEQIVATIRRTGEPIIGVEVNGQRPDGSNTERVWITYWHPLKDSGGQVIGVNVAAEEITARKRAEAELAAGREHLRRLNETLAERVEAQAQERDRIWQLSQDLLLVTDARGTILNVNPAWSATLGWPAEGLIGANVEQLIHPNDRERTRFVLEGLAAGQRTRHLENRIAGQDGRYRLVSWFAVQDRERVYAAGRDITDLREAREQLHRLRRQLAAASQQSAMGAMAASIAHEINQPLGAVVANANAGLRFLSGDHPDLDEAKETLAEIVRSGHRAAEVILAIRAMFGKEHQEKASLDVNEVVREVLALLDGELEQHSILVCSELAEGLPRVTAARVQLQQVILNLINNAIEAMSATRPEARRLRLSSGAHGPDAVRIAVEDAGPGIDPEKLDRIFDPFFTTKPTGMGMGLSICRSIVEAHGGRLLASRPDGGGSLFEIALPADEPRRAG